MLYGVRRDNLRHKALELWIHCWGVSFCGSAPKKLGCGRHASDSNGRDAKKRHSSISGCANGFPQAEMRLLTPAASEMQIILYHKYRGRAIML